MDLMQELREHGVADLPVSYGLDGTVSFMGDVSAADRAAVEGIVAGYDFATGAPVRRLSPAESFAAAKAAKQAAVNARREAIIAAGFSHDFGAGLGVRTLDQRGAGDETAWLGLKMLAQDLKMDGQGAAVLAIRDQDNGTFSVSAEAASEAMTAMGLWRAAVMARSWALKDAVAAAGDAAAVAAIDIEAGWPA